MSENRKHPPETAAGAAGRPDRRGRGLLKNIVFSLIVAAVALAVILAVLEIGLRAAGWTRTFEIVERVEAGTPRTLRVRTLHANTVIHHVTKEFDVTYRSNSMGYFDREWKRDKDPGVPRIAFFGDSFTMGHGVGSAHAFPRLIERNLRDHRNRSVETMNFGVWGSGTLDEREYIEDAVALGVDQVVVCFYINDIFDNVRYRNEERTGTAFGAGDSVQAEPASSRQRTLIRFKEFLNAHSRAFAFVSERTKNLRDALGLVTYPLEGVFTGRSNHLLEETAGYLSEIAADLGARGIPLTVVYLPAKVQISSTHAPEGFDLDLPQRLLSEHLENYRLIDLTDEFRGVDVNEFWFREGHYNERGHALVAGWLAERLAVSE